jgi:hypothetical protein
MDTEKTAKKAGKIAIWTALIVVALVIIILLLRFIIKKLKSSPDTKSNKQAEKEIEKNKLSYSQSEYSSMADRIYQEMNGINSFTDSYSSTFDVLKKLKTDSDWKALNVAFGTRESTFGLPFTNKFKGDLVKWMEDELTSSQLKDAGNILSKIDVNVF